MKKLLVLADDFTGALDTGVKFAQQGISTRVLVGGESPQEDIDADVTVMCLDTRHLPPSEAAQIVGSIVRPAKKVVPYIMKKTDSALRGNVGSELAATLYNTGESRLPFFPAFPAMGRLTVGGVQMIGEVPVAESVFGQDPFEPVRVSFIPEIIGAQTDAAVAVKKAGEIDDDKGILVYDSESEEDIRATAHKLQEKGRLSIMAGCAGLAAVLPEVLGLESAKVELPAIIKPLVVISGSLNAITLRQLDHAAQKGFYRKVLSARQKLDPDFAGSDECAALIDELWQAYGRGCSLIICSDSFVGEGDVPEDLARRGISPEEGKTRVVETLAYIAQQLALRELHASLLFTGGDTLLAFIKRMDCTELHPLGELGSGIVLSELVCGQKSYQIISKSGGFGDERLLAELAN